MQKTVCVLLKKISYSKIHGIFMVIKTKLIRGKALKGLCEQPYFELFSEAKEGGRTGHVLCKTKILQ